MTAVDVGSINVLPEGYVGDMSEEDDYDMHAVVDDGSIGPDPTKEYMERLDLLDNAVRECTFVSKSYGGIASPTSRHFYASVLFTALITRGVSLLMLAPHTPWADKKIEHWDYASLAGIVRTMIEIRIAYYYLCAEKCSDDEWNFRWNLFNLHDCTSRIRLFDAIGDVEQVQGFKAQADELRERLTSNAFFHSLDTKRHKKLLHGQTAYLFPLEEIAEKAGIAVNLFRWLYVLFSSHVHSLPMSFYRIGGDNPDRGRGLPSLVEETYSSLCLSLAADLLVQTRDEVHRLFEGLGRKGGEGAVSDAPSDVVEDSMAEGLAVGESVTVNATDDIQIVVTRKEDDAFDLSYHYTLTGEVVLERSVSGSGESEIKSIEPFFWQFFLNGEPTTEKALIKAMEVAHALKVDHVKKKIMIKT